MRFVHATPIGVRIEVERSELYVAFVVCTDELMKDILQVAACLASTRLRAAGFVGKRAREGEDEMDHAIVTGGGISGTPTVSFASSIADAFEEFVSVFAVEWEQSSATCIVVADAAVTLESVMSSYLNVTSL